MIETIPTFAWTALPDGSIDFANRNWVEYYGFVHREDGGLGLGSRRSPGRLEATYGEMARLGGDRRAVRR